MSTVNNNTMPSHSTNSSTDSSFSSSSTGASYQLILEHVFQYPGSFEIPLRTMYTINSEPRIQPTTSPIKDSFSSPGQAQTKSQKTAAQVATAQFSSALVNHIARLPSQPCSLPPVFITNFLLRCFPLELELVDFPQALTGLDYLKDLETRRRREAAASMKRIGIDPSTLGTGNDISMRHTGVAAWLATVEAYERKVEALYTQIYIGLRRWILINELSLKPFNIHNCLAMLNTLYPPSSPATVSRSTHGSNPSTRPTTPTQPTTVLTPAVLKKQRDAFFKWTREVETKGSGCLKPILAPDRQHASDATGWPAVHESLDAYLRVANHIIEDCNEVQGLEDFDKEGLKSRRKKDSGISFGSGQSSKRGSLNNLGDKNKSLPTPPVGSTGFTSDARESLQRQQALGGEIPERGLSALERIAREVRKIKMSRASPQQRSTTNLNNDNQSAPGTPNLHSRNNSDNSNGGSADPSQSQPLSPRSRSRGTASGTQNRSDGPNNRPWNLRRSFSRSRVEGPSLSSSDIHDPMPRLYPSSSSTSSGSKTLRKLRSLGDMKRATNQSGENISSFEAFDREEMKEARAAYDAKQAQAKHAERKWQTRGASIGMAQ